ncbi:MAG: zinc-ribbon domain-containing protein [Candidatus Heimdallarchaeota archaeon]|nr:MAG: zinc-ribbon domain-containing protein [Candidatus Heimdallarchaeota archaeon]
MNAESKKENDSNDEKKPRRPHCKSCGKELPHIARYCPVCGEQLF